MAKSTELALYSWVIILAAVLLESNSLLAEAPAFFVFGDSLVDNGNNNFLVTTARADMPPYGIDFPTHQPTGRFSNGFNIPDLISQEIGATEPPLPYLSPEILNKKKLLVGANFASAGVGILNDTGFQFLNIINMHQQLYYFKEYQHRVSAIIGHEKTRKLVNTAVVLITVGGNDFVNNYYLVPNSARSRQFSLPNYVNFLMGEYRKILMKLYELGALRVIVTDTGSLGCVPAELAMRGERDGGCAQELQQASDLYNPKLLDMVQGLNQELGKNVFIVASPIMEFLSNPGAYGFTSSKVACCGQGPYNGIGLCTEVSHLCSNRDLYVFWDPFHPSEKACRLIAEQIMRGPNMYPMNLSTIMDLDWRT